MGRIIYKVQKIDGDYAHLINIETGEDILVAIALLPDETDEGVLLNWENFEYSLHK